MAFCVSFNFSSIITEINFMYCIDLHSLYHSDCKKYKIRIDKFWLLKNLEANGKQFCKYLIVPTHLINETANKLILDYFLNNRKFFK